MEKNTKREAIISAAKKLIIEKGYRKTSVQDITEQVGIAKGSFYTYFKSKDFLMETLLVELEEYHKKFIEELLDDNKSLEETIEEYIEYYLTIPVGDIEVMLVMLKMMRSIDSVGINVIKKLKINRQERKEEFIKILKKYEQEIDIESEEDFSRFGLLIFSMINTFYINNFLPVENRLAEVGLEEVKKRISEVDFEYEIKFTTKSVLKLIKK